jgi:hypothetical protein
VLVEHLNAHDVRVMDHFLGAVHGNALIFVFLSVDVHLFSFTERS